MSAPEFRKILVIQTAYAGDVILTLPLVQSLRTEFPGAAIDMLVVPRCAELLRNHPAVGSVIIYDKRGGEAGISGFLAKVRTLRSASYDLAVIPHRSIRSALLARFARIPRRIGFSSSSGKFLFTDVVPYVKSIHEIERNLSLLDPLRQKQSSRILPAIYPSISDRMRVDAFLAAKYLTASEQIVGVAPGTAWNTKRWLPERFSELVGMLLGKGCRVLLIGGSEDEPLCDEICRTAGTSGVISAAGMLSMLQSAEIIRRCKVLVCNDSAPMHLAVAMHVPVVAIFGATVPSFGFGPYGENDTVVETLGLSCRPCSIHGGDRCPVKTFDCMKNISAAMVFERVMARIGNHAAGQ